MDNTELNRIVLRRKKEKVIRTIILASEYCNLTIPEINFDGCPLEGANGPELAHYHVGGNKICISERQLMKQNEYGLEETAIHEVIHHLGLMHGSAAERAKFQQIKNYVRARGWRPPKNSGAQFISGEQVNERSKRIRDDPERFAWVNEDSDYVKFVEGRSRFKENVSSKKDNEKKRDVETGMEKKIPKKNKGKIRKGSKVRVTKMSKKEIEEARSRLFVEKEEEKEYIEKIREANRKMIEERNKEIEERKKERGKVHVYQKVGMSKEEIEESRKKLGIDTEYKPRARAKKKGIFDKVKEALGIT